MVLVGDIKISGFSSRIRINTFPLCFPEERYLNAFSISDSENIVLGKGVTAPLFIPET